ncbi:hypothetical protein [Paraburkholderia sp.]|uniref:hypothetical protein n=1 Tax=Paraburkholderia sp. TaxID=1926495 RepID=UPI002D6EC882|nr:hypothetical protein [Paraburkholderia sp.]HZZ05465.1 hypothetical protein [Paraburkholderia sp.]
MADEIVRIVALPSGERPMRPVIDFVGDGAREVLEVSERVASSSPDGSACAICSKRRRRYYSELFAAAAELVK